MKPLLVLATVTVLLAACSDPEVTLRRQAIQEYRESWTSPDQLRYVRTTHGISEEYGFTGLELRGSARSDRDDYSLYEWSFRFVKAYDDAIEVRHICYYDTDALVMFDVKQERIHWRGSKFPKKSYTFRHWEDEMSQPSEPLGPPL